MALLSQACLRSFPLITWNMNFMLQLHLHTRFTPDRSLPEFWLQTLCDLQCFWKSYLKRAFLHSFLCSVSFGGHICPPLSTWCYLSAPLSLFKTAFTTVFPKTDNSHTVSVFITLPITFFSLYLYICQLVPIHSLSTSIDMVNSWKQSLFLFIWFACKALTTID